ncbi:MAG: DUF3619 family protein [Betaproteobacteria bacterium]|nr:DUF3619 family protein [Betaproteobacteria bacterium]
MNEQLFGNKVRHLLNQGLRANVHDESRVGARLKAARDQALARQRAEPAGALAWADNVAGRFGGWAGLSLKVVLPSLMLVAAAGGLYAWQQNQRAAELEEIDAQLLTDDLPIDAYLDRGFQNYLKKTSATAEEQ